MIVDALAGPLRRCGSQRGAVPHRLGTGRDAGPPPAWPRRRTRRRWPTACSVTTNDVPCGARSPSTSASARRSWRITSPVRRPPSMHCSPSTAAPQAATFNRLSADIDDSQVWMWSSHLDWRPWYAAVWVEAAVLAHDQTHRGPGSIEARHAARDNPIASTIIERAADDRGRRPRAVENLAATFRAAGLPVPTLPHGRTCDTPALTPAATAGPESVQRCRFAGSSNTSGI